MKAIIPVAGVGTQLRPQTHTQPKALVPVAGKPILSHIIDFLREGGVSEYVFVIGYLGTRIRQYLTEAYDGSGLSFEFVMQTPREGSAHALYMAKEHFEDEVETLVMLGDTIIYTDLKKFVGTPGSALGVKKVNDPTAYGIAEVDRKGLVTKLVEKPRIPKSNKGLVGLYKIGSGRDLAEAAAEVVRSGTRTNGEYHLTDALGLMVASGTQMRAVEVDSWFDCGSKTSVLAANATLLKKPGFRTRAHNRFVNTVIIPPVRIEDGCAIDNAVIGPNVVIGAGSKLSRCIVRNSILGAFNRIEQAVLEDTLLGNDVSLRGPAQSLNTGDNTEIVYTGLV